MANVSKINFNGEALDIKDIHAREQIQHLTTDNYTADVTGDYTVNAGNIAMSSANATMHTTADRTIDTDGNDSVHIEGASTLNVGGLRTETFAGDKTETVTGTATEKYNNLNTTVTGKWMVNTPTKNFSMADVATGADVTEAVGAEKAAREAADAELSARIERSKQYTHFVVIGDSYSTTVQTGGPVWYTYLEKQSGLTAYTNALDGVGFSVGGNNDFIHQIQKAADALDVTKVKTVYIFGGLNDLAHTSTSYDQFKQACDSTIEKAIELFPLSEIVVAGIPPFQNYNFASGNSTFPKNRAYHLQNRLAQSSANHGIKFINLEYLGLFTPNYFGPANVNNQKHPSSTGSAVIASAIMSGYSYAGNNINPELKPTISSGSLIIRSTWAESPNRVSINIEVKPSSENFTIDWNGFPLPPFYLVLNNQGGNSIVGYYDGGQDRGVTVFSHAKPQTSYYGSFIVNV